MTDNYDALINEPHMLWSLSSFEGGEMNCPATADAVDNFLITGARIPSLHGNIFNIAANFTNISNMAGIVSELNRQGHGHHFVVRGNRRNPPHHYFLMVNIRGQIYLVDAYTHQVLHYPEGCADYLRQSGFVSYSYAASFVVTTIQQAHRVQRAHRP